METLSFEQMENVQGGINWCNVGKGVSGLGAIALGFGATFTCGAAAGAYGLIVGATIMFC